MDALFVPDYSGGNPYQRELADALTARGIDVDMAISGVDNLPFTAAVREHGVPDVLHLHWIYPFLVGKYRAVTVLKGTRLLTELLALKAMGVRVVWTVHNLVDHERRTPRVECAYRSAVARLCDALVVHCPAAREAVLETYDLPGRYRERIAVAPHGHYVDSYPTDVSARQARRSLGIDPETTTYLYFGRIREYKNLPALIDAFGRLEAAEAALYVVGRPGTDRLDDDLADRCRSDERVTYVPEFVPEDEVQLYMNAADVVVLPFRDVLSSGSAILAMSFGNPVVAPRIGCLDALLDGQPELGYDPDDPRGLERALAAARTADLDALGAANRQRVLAEHDWDDVAARTAAVYAGD